ncbi:PH domain-containing protein [Gordonia sp. (in: high G+C Gram-positive bacteria)]|uniref:PH domain-containing protein n=1 Tax=Gordonia sp. (in: high G+C Gram-positive bacteria) TaxID=84139 RepID=UPI0016A64C16|nr:PH domain-containing protein [Gordonia sp. (in: high G+C Gram-positive bacteria)]NLG46172.1 PH domain-containing protein [Gordonia sp. (in: high G+C Gram-positive bacteria)]
MSLGFGDAQADTWEFVYKPRWMRQAAWVAIAVVMVIHLTFGFLLDITYTGVNIDWWDKFSLIGVGVLICAVILFLTRSRVRVGPDGIGVLNLVSERVFTWDQMIGLEYPEKGFCARLLFPGDEHIPVMAIQARDGDAAVAAMSRIREYGQKYGARQDAE